MRLAQLSQDARRAFATACAERLLRADELLRVADDATSRWREVLDAIWAGLAGDQHGALAAVERALGEECLEDADHDPAAASIYAAECYVRGGIDEALSASQREIDAAFEAARVDLQLDPNDFVWAPDAEPAMPLAREAMHAAVQGALARQLSDLDELEREPLTPTLLLKLRSETIAGVTAFRAAPPVSSLLTSPRAARGRPCGLLRLWDNPLV